MAGQDKSSDSFLIVGIGASAGGLEAFKTFLRHMDENSGMAFVLISHLSPNHESLLSELLDKETGMSVTQVHDTILVEPNRVYVIPPDADLTIEEGSLRLCEPVEARGHRLPIDVFFRSLAEDRREDAVCVVLSGTGSDGTVGLKAIKESGGLAIAQDSKTASYDDMPRSAVLTGLVDYVLPVEEIPAALVEYARHREALRADRGEENFFAETAEYLDEICSFLRRRLGHDFSGYKKNTLIRRIQRRIQITQMNSVSAYVEYLRLNEDEVDLLFKDLLIGVTHFFRNSESFAVLKQTVIVPLVKDRKSSGRPIRVWVAGCSSGEEVYSLAMLICEEVERQKVNSQIYIFASDIDEQALEKARQSRYPFSIAEQISQERLKRFFVKQDGFYQVTKKLREMCIFSQHSLISDPPFSRLDLITCRNLLIYLDTELQKRVLPLFHYALNPSGYLFLGSSESLVGNGELFREVDKQHRIFQQKQTMIQPQIDFPLRDRSNYRYTERSKRQSYSDYQQNIDQTIEKVLLRDHTPACVIINKQNEVIYFYGRTGKYLEPSPGPPSNDLFSLARQGLRIELRTAVQAAIRTQKAIVREGVTIEFEQQIQLVNLIVRPLAEIDEDGSLLMIIFQDINLQNSYESKDCESEGGTKVVQQLEDELRTVKEHLRSTIEELETSNEELKSANEELLSMNEELQSSNEELQTSKEETHSINEELETVNAELRSKIEEVDAAKNDTQNLFESTRIATVFLDLNLRIKKFTPTATSVFNFIETDIGRPITDISLSLEGVDIVADATKVMDSLIPIEREIRLQGENTYYKMRVLPYRTVENAIDGAVITFVDNTNLHLARDWAEQAAQRQRAIAEFGLYALQSIDADDICDRAIQILCKILKGDYCSLFVCQPDGVACQVSTDSLLLKSGSGWEPERVGKLSISAIDSHLGYTLTVKQPVIVENLAQETRFTLSDLSRELQITSGVSAIVYGSDGAYGVLATHSIEARRFTPEDASFIQAIANGLGSALQRQKTTLALTKSRERLDLALNAGKMGVWELDLKTGLSTWNQNEYELFGLNSSDTDEPSEDLFYSYVYSDDVLRVRQELKATIEQKTEFNSEFRINRADGELRWLAAHGRIITNSNGDSNKIIGINYDVTERKQNEEALREADRRKDEFLATLGHELRNPLNAIINSIELISKSENATDSKQFSNIAKRQSKHLTHLVDDLLDASRVTYGKIRLNCEIIDLTQLLQELLSDYEESLQAKELVLNRNLLQESVWIRGDLNRLTQAFSNILHNAIKFSYVKGRITISMALDNDWVRVEIADTGMGIESEALSRIFTTFSQENRSIAGSDGLGLGLPLAKGIIELHKGRIQVSSAGRDRGTEFVIKLPRLERESLDANLIKDEESTSKVIQDEPDESSSNGRRVLIIEDEADSAFLIQTFLDSLGYEIEIAFNGIDGIALARQFSPDVILSDISLTEEMDGYSVARTIRNDSELNSICLIAISGYGQPEDKEKAKAAGFDAHLTKPLNLDLVKDSIAEKTAQTNKKF